MIEIDYEYGRQLLAKLLELNPAWASGLLPGNGIPIREGGISPRIEIPSAHPTITTPLMVELDGTFSLYWWDGYFYDFIGDMIGRNPADDAFEFLQDFFAEKVWVVSIYDPNGGHRGGPVFEEYTRDWDDYGELLICEWFERAAEWSQVIDRIEIRSWRGTYDQTVRDTAG